MGQVLHFLSSPPEPGQIYHGVYNPIWVVLSVFLAILASYAALNAATRVQLFRETGAKILWSVICALTLGVGIWSMHFIGMLAFKLPCIIRFDFFITALSILPAILASGVALDLWHFGSKQISTFVASVLLGSGIGIMHYSGMAALKIEGFVAYDPGLFVLSIILAILLAYAALRVKGNKFISDRKKRDVFSAVILGGAISAMHYTAMSATYFVKGHPSPLPTQDLSTNTLALEIVIIAVFLALATLSLAAISRQRQLTKQLRDSEERLKIATASSEIGIWEYDVISNELFWDDTMFNLYQVSKEDVPDPYTAWTSRLHPDDKAEAIAVPEDAVKGKSDYSREFRIILPDGFSRYIKGNARIVKDQTGKAIRVIGTDWDNSQHHLIQRQLMFANAAINKSMNAFYWLNSEGQVVDINEFACQSLGYSRKELVGQYIWFFDPEFVQETWPRLWEYLKNDVTSIFESQHQRKDGAVFPVEITASYLVVEGNEFCFFYSHDLTKRKANEEKIKELAYYDPLTKLPNRRLLEERLIHAIARGKRDNLTHALLMFDLDRFKAVNDSLGHSMGDELLQQVATRMTSMLRRVDTIARLGSVARLGGDEFVVLLENIGEPDNAAVVSNKIISIIDEPFRLSESDDVRIGASIGISLYPQHGETPEKLLECADAALYRAKDQGRGCFAFFTEALTLAIRERIALEARLRKAIRQDELLVHYQPQVDISSGLIIGAEALVRWQDPTEGLIPPYRFIPIAEETSLIVDIGEWVLRETCRQGRKWLDMGLPKLTLAVNVSPQQFRRSDITNLVARVLKETGFPPGLLELEITETGLMENKENAKGILNTLHEQGIHLAIDDFGTGYSSLAHLKHFPLDVLKIDKSFIDEIPENKDDMEIAATIVAMGHILGFKVLAEGVENQDQLAFLEKTGCDAYQGYFKSRPIPADEFVKLFQEKKSEFF